MPFHDGPLLLADAIKAPSVPIIPLGDGAGQLRPREVAIDKRRVPEISAPQGDIGKLAALEYGHSHVTPRQIGPAEVAVGEDVTYRVALKPLDQALIDAEIVRKNPLLLQAPVDNIDRAEDRPPAGP
jgi:hypothetical protein